MNEVVLLPGASRETIAEASEILAMYLREFCGAALHSLREQREFLACCRPLRDDGCATSQARELDLLDVTRALKRVAHARQRPLPRAERETRRLAALLDGVPFERLVIAPASLTACLRPAAQNADSPPEASFDICLPSPVSLHFPVLIREYTAAGRQLAFVQHGARHGACRGEAASLIETAVERLDLCGIVLVALAWARRNL